jgi:CRP-like cAMP-binding protein
MKVDDLGKDLADGEVIFREGDPGNCMYIILEDRIRITKNTPGGDLYITTLEEGEIFGEMRKATEALTNVLEEMAE